MQDDSSKSDRNEPFSLHGMTPEDALRKALSTPPPEKPVTCPKCDSFLIHTENDGGETEIRCPKHGLLGTIKAPV